MELQMFLAGNLIDTTPVHDMHMKHPGYINTLKLKLEEKNEDILESTGIEPEYYIASIPSSMNYYSLI